VNIGYKQQLLHPTAVTPTQPDCKINTGSVELSNLPAGNWTVNPGTISEATTTATITGLIVGTYNFTVTMIQDVHR
jgi:hypothetical protein